MNFISQHNFLANERLLLGPAGNCDSKSSPDYGGLGWGYWSRNNGTIRGGDCNDGNKAGIFAFENIDDPYDDTLLNGFRCTSTGIRNDPFGTSKLLSSTLAP